MEEMNPILEQCIKNKGGHYCHVLEVEDTYDLQNVADSIWKENEDEHGVTDILDFLETLTIICTKEENEIEVYGFSFTEYLEKNRVF